MPISAGLGSSASYSVCAATASLLVHSRISLPQPPVPSSSDHVSHQGRRTLSTAIAEEVNRWAFVAEKILHGNPSGVDNSVAVYGGALCYARPGFGRKSGMEGIQE
jgi:mevalonate kinase